MDIAKLKKQFQKASAAAIAARQNLDEALDAFAAAERVRAVAREQLDQAEALEVAMELRAKKALE